MTLSSRPQQATDAQPKNGSWTFCLPPIIGCLVVAEQVLGPNREWKAANTKQSELLGTPFKLGRGAVMGMKEIVSLASYKPDAINRFLQELGYSIQLPPYQKPDFGMASVLKVLVEWVEKGKAITIRNGSYPGVLLEQGVTYHTSPHSTNPIAAIKTKEGSTVCMMEMANPPKGFELLQRLALIDETEKQVHGYKGVIFPMVDYDRQEDTSWTVGLTTRGDDGVVARVAHAAQQTKFKMNEVGAKVESAAAMMMTRSIPRYLQIERDLLVWVYHPSFVGQPLFAGYFTEEVYKNPGKITG